MTVPMGSYGDLRSISGYTESLSGSLDCKDSLKQSWTIFTSAKGLNIFVFVFSNYIGNLCSSQGLSGACSVRLRELLQACMFIKVFPENGIPIQSL